METNNPSDKRPKTSMAPPSQREHYANARDSRSGNSRRSGSGRGRGDRGSRGSRGGRGFRGAQNHKGSHKSKEMGRAEWRYVEFLALHILSGLINEAAIQWTKEREMMSNIERQSAVKEMVKKRLCQFTLPNSPRKRSMLKRKGLSARLQS